jgi:hypothetical protein
LECDREYMSVESFAGPVTRHSGCQCSPIQQRMMVYKPGHPSEGRGFYQCAVGVRHVGQEAVQRCQEEVAAPDELESCPAPSPQEFLRSQRSRCSYFVQLAVRWQVTYVLLPCSEAEFLNPRAHLVFVTMSGC